MADKIIARRFRRYLRCLIDPDLLNSLWLRRLAAGEEEETEKNLNAENESESAFAHGQFHVSQRMVVRNLASVAVAVWATPDLQPRCFRGRRGDRLQNILHRLRLPSTM